MHGMASRRGVLHDAVDRPQDMSAQGYRASRRIQPKWSSQLNNGGFAWRTRRIWALGACFWRRQEPQSGRQERIEAGSARGRVEQVGAAAESEPRGEIGEDDGSPDIGLSSIGLPSIGIPGIGTAAATDEGDLRDDGLVAALESKRKVILVAGHRSLRAPAQLHRDGSGPTGPSLEPEFGFERATIVARVQSELEQARPPDPPGEHRDARMRRPAAIEPGGRGPCWLWCHASHLGAPSTRARILVARSIPLPDFEIVFASPSKNTQSARRSSIF
jgi:hypothetical protein